MSKGKQCLLQVSFLFRIDRIAPSYSFGIGMDRFDDGPYSEHTHVEIRGTCLAPLKLFGRETHFTFIGDSSVAATVKFADSDTNRPTGIGKLTMRGSQSTYLGSLPLGVCMPLATLISAQGVRFIVMSGPAMLRGSTMIQSIHFVEDADPEAY